MYIDEEMYLDEEIYLEHARCDYANIIDLKKAIAEIENRGIHNLTYVDEVILSALKKEISEIRSKMVKHEEEKEWDFLGYFGDDINGHAYWKTVPAITDDEYIHTRYQDFGNTTYRIFKINGEDKSGFIFTKYVIYKSVFYVHIW